MDTHLYHYAIHIHTASGLPAEYSAITRLLQQYDIAKPASGAANHYLLHVARNYDDKIVIAYGEMLIDITRGFIAKLNKMAARYPKWRIEFHAYDIKQPGSKDSEVCPIAFKTWKNGVQLPDEEKGDDNPSNAQI